MCSCNALARLFQPLYNTDTNRETKCLQNAVFGVLAAWESHQVLLRVFWPLTSQESRPPSPSLQVAAGGGNDQALTLAAGGASGGPGAGLAGGALMGASQALHPGEQIPVIGCLQCTVCCTLYFHLVQAVNGSAG